MKNNFIICFMLLGNLLQAQTSVKSGVIEYDKSVNMYALLQKTTVNETFAQQTIDLYKKDHPQFSILKSTLSFSRNNSLFSPEEVALKTNQYPYAAQNNIVYTDYPEGIVTAQRSVMGQNFLLRDSIRAIKWKITDETRDIAGFSCRRANGLLLDSIYIVAFYTTDIPVSGGPESFSGLPGMILQVSLPHDNISWTATRVTDKPVSVVKPVMKGKPSTYKELSESIMKLLQNYGASKAVYLKTFLF